MKIGEALEFGGKFGGRGFIAWHGVEKGVRTWTFGLTAAEYIAVAGALDFATEGAWDEAERVLTLAMAYVKHKASD